MRDTAVRKPHRFNRPSTAKRRRLYRLLMLRDGPRCTCCERPFTWDDNPPTLECDCTPILSDCMDQAIERLLHAQAGSVGERDA